MRFVLRKCGPNWKTLEREDKSKKTKKQEKKRKGSKNKEKIEKTKRNSRIYYCEKKKKSLILTVIPRKDENYENNKW